MPHSNRHCLGAYLLSLLLGCASSSVDSSFDRAGGPNASEQPGSGQEQASCSAEALTTAGTVIELEDSGSDWWACSVPATDAPECVCIEGYTGLAKRIPELATPITAEELDQELRAVDPDLGGSIDGNIAIRTDPTNPDELADELVSAMGLCDLRSGLEERELTVATLGEQHLANYTQRDLRFEDPYLGGFGVMLLLPHGEGPFPAVIALGGHGDDMEIFRDTYHGDWYPPEGIALAIPIQRGICGDENEDEMTRQLLLGGFSVAGIRTIEVMLVLKYLHHIPQVDGARVGLIGHSTGSVIGNAVVRSLPGVRAWVTDLFGTYFTFVDNPLIDNSMAPRLYPYHELINDISTLPIPAMEVGYGFGTANEDDPQQPNQLPEILEFFSDSL